MENSITDVFCTANVMTAENVAGPESACVKETENLVDSSTLTVKSELMIQQPKPQKAIPLRSDDYKKLKKCCKTIKMQKVSFVDFLFGLATLLLGGSISAIISCVSLNSPLGIIFFIVCPILTVGIGVSCIFLKILQNKKDKMTAEKMLTILESLEEGENEE